MSQSSRIYENNTSGIKPPPFWKVVILLIILCFVAIGLFGAIIYFFINGAQQLGLSPIVNVAVIVIISGIFAWLVKRIADIVSGMSRHWFPEEDDQNSYK
jgi:membrane protein implicated in regulation of membrane protease activity